MSRDARVNDKRIAKARRSIAMERHELRAPTTPRVSAAGPTSMAIKADDPATRRMIDDAIAKRRGE